MKKILIFFLTITGMVSLSAAKLDLNVIKTTKGYIDITLLGTGGIQLKTERIWVKSDGTFRKTFNVSGAIEAIVWKCEDEFYKDKKIVREEFYAYLGISRMSIRTIPITIRDCDGRYEYKGKTLWGESKGSILLEE